MDRRPENFDRRTFIKGVAATATVLTTGIAQATTPREKTISLTGAVPTRTFGKTGHALPVLGMGGAVMQDKYAELVAVPKQSFEARVQMIRHGYERGLRYVDTARGYGVSESIIGTALKDVRHDVFLATKIWAFTPGEVRKSVETSLKELQTEYVDALQIHGPLLREVGFEGGMKLHAEMVRLRDEGLTRYIGLTGHDSFETMYRMVATGGFDQLLIAYGYMRKGMLNLLSHTDLEWRDLCIAEANQLGMGIVSMKVMAGFIYGHSARNVVPQYDGGALARLPGAAIRWVLSDPRVSILNIGVCLPSDIDQNIQTLKGDTRLTNADRLLLADFTRRAYENPAFKRATGKGAASLDNR